MTDHALVVVSDPPAAVVAGSGLDYGMLTMQEAINAADLAGHAYRLADEGPDDVESLRASVNQLSDAVRLLSGMLTQLTIGVENHRIAAVTQV